jgi:hypothetical protein
MFLERFEHYERLADIQMLAMLACIFCEPAAREGISNIMAGIRAEVYFLFNYLNNICSDS